MTPWWVLLGLAAAAGITAPVAAAAPMDCPLARAPYSSRTPLADLLLDARAKAMMDRTAPGLLEDFTRPFGGGPLPPGFATILNPMIVLQGRSDGAALAAELDRGLATVAITPAATRARCARYDADRPALPKNMKRPALLVFDKINGFRDGPSVDAATGAVKAIAARRGWTIMFSDKGGVFNARDLARFDAVFWNNVSGDVLTVTQQDAFKAWLSRGGGYAGVHGSAGDPLYVWDWYADTLVGARFKGHPMAPQFQEARIVVADPAHGVSRGLPREWRMTEEWYSFERSPRLKGAHVLATLDEMTYRPIGIRNQDLKMGDHPIAWTHCIGAGRSFYSAVGHRPESYTEPNSARLLEQGIAWAMGLGETRCARGQEVPKQIIQ